MSRARSCSTMSPMSNGRWHSYAPAMPRLVPTCGWICEVQSWQLEPSVVLTERGDRTEVCRQTSRQRGSQSSSTSTTSSSARYKTCSININTASHIHPTVSHIFPAIFRQSLRGRVLRLTYACAPPDEPACDPVHEQGPERAQGDGAQAKRLPGPHLSRLVRYPPCYSYSRRHVGAAVSDHIRGRAPVQAGHQHGARAQDPRGHLVPAPLGLSQPKS
eukprot:823067-Rhodomonas_salina.2